jgi:hypothetical protein
VVVPIAEYQQLRQAADEQRINEEFEAARVGGDFLRARHAWQRALAIFDGSPAS